jgi:hypothetical protein
VEIKQKVCYHRGMTNNTNRESIVNGEKQFIEYKESGDEVNGVPFNGHYQIFSFGYEAKNYLKESELSGDEYRKGGNVWISRNGVKVYSEFCRTQERALNLIHEFLPKIMDFDFNMLVVGRKVYHGGVESILESLCSNGEIFLRTEDGKSYEIYGEKKESMKEDANYEDEWKDKDRVHFTDSRIYWYRS